MAFWGVEVKAGKPYTHVYDESRGRLRVSQATLGNGKSMEKSVVQCNVGDKSAILLCSLIPDRAETCHLDLEFEEYDDVMFSVLGPRSVHLSGYYLGSSRRNGGSGDESDSYGEDIAGTESDNSSSYDTEDDEYESDFIDDDDIEMYTSSTPQKSNVVIEEIIEDDKSANGNANRLRIKKKNQVSDSDDDGCQRQLVKRNNSTILESEDEDGFPIFSLRTKKTIKDAVGSAKSDATILSEDRKRKLDVISPDAKPARAEGGAENDEKSKKKKKEKHVDGEPLEMISTENILSDNENHGVQSTDANIENKGNDLAVKDEAVGTESDGNFKKKKKERVKKGKTPESSDGLDEAVKDTKVCSDDAMDQDLPVEAEKLQTDKEAVDSSLPSGTTPESSGKQKKKKKKKAKVNTQEKGGQEEMTQTLKDKVDYDEKKLAKSKDNGNINENLLVSKQPDNKGVNANGDSAADSLQQETKKKKKKNKNHENNSNINQETLKVLTEQKNEAQPTKARSFPNGFTVEELSMGKPDGKRASHGNKVSVNYVGKLQNGKIFDSTVGKKPFTFRLGIGEVIKGWDIGVEGMRVGDKRRLTIPPSLGYGVKSVGKIPGNSWLVFDVELVSVK